MKKRSQTQPNPQHGTQRKNRGNVRDISEAGTPVPASTEVSYLLSFLAILVHRNGGELVIENLSSFAGHETGLNYELDNEGDRVILRAKVEPMKEPPPVIFNTSVFHRRDRKQ